ncbi:hypothetical protein ROZALSC1DRAFT_28396 [Rozella allomycis CSF55]|uniref:Uncharacterized protein n=1 Tax=Rozella allomycis (strain CSF55) TaxID=988480 RepID=A0A075B015_ROZAC|nr:hypothetical protein O9G_004153 [Rozella allomycis CSF55]RKP20077.1 hypothetical protein ROZALSC1DRAFT_28396 [Rozella allomycis CSF55]|eukprot:EPZ35868.1 hypothetical protein O9G_004153 [Rozella allomycis CSF55]
MVQLRLVRDELSQNEDFILLDLQGSIERNAGEEESENDVIGKMDFDGETAKLTIGNQELVGKVEKLKKPLVILEAPIVTKDDMEEENTPNQNEIIIPDYKMRQFIRKKIVFKSRPRTLV